MTSGAIWRRIDLHLHSPGVATFALPSGFDIQNDQGRLIDEYVDQLVAQEIRVGAITDYNGVREEWYTPLSEHAASKGIVLLPGAELSFNHGKYGLHVLAVFEMGTPPSSINSFILSLDQDPGTPLLNEDRTHRDITCTTNPVDGLTRLREKFDCLLIPPHPNQTNGFCKSLQPKDAAQFLSDLRPDALEHCPAGDLQRMRSTGVLDTALLERLAIVEFSDPKKVEDIGTKESPSGPRETYLRLSASDLGALRLALHDPTTRVSVPRPKPPTHPRIRSISFDGAGFLGSMNVDWNEYLNVIIGGRGAGKSAVIEGLRYALDLRVFDAGEHRAGLVRHALGSGGKVSVVVERLVGESTRKRYRIERIFGEAPRVYEDDTGRLTEIAPSEVFGPQAAPTVLGQREIYEVSRSSEYRIRLLDELIGEEAKRRAGEVAEAIELLRANAREIVEAREKLGKREEYEQRLKSIQHEMAVYEEHGVAAKLRDSTSLRVGETLIKSALTELQRSSEVWRNLAAEVLSPLQAVEDELKGADCKQKELLLEASAEIETLRGGFTARLDQGEADFTSAMKKIGAIQGRWTEALRPLEAELNKIKQELQGGSLDPDRLLALAGEQAELNPRIKELDRLEEALNALELRRAELIETSRQKRHEEHSLRRSRVEGIETALGERLRLRVEFKGQKDEYAVQLAALLKGSRVNEDAIQRLVSPDAADGPSLAEAIGEGSEEVARRYSLTSAVADRLVNWFTGDEVRMFELQVLSPADSLTVMLRIDGQDRPLDQLSGGQRATAILLLLFALKGRILILDQPEDDLDNRFVYEDIVAMLRVQKGIGDESEGRQIIAATHNANIPVLGDAELVLSLEARGDRAHVTGRSSIDHQETRELIKAVMEGGEEAFQRRAEKYESR